LWGQHKLIDPTANLSELIEVQTGAPPGYNSAYVYEGLAFGEDKPLKAIVCR
jgi:hypothetical protein